MFILEERCVPKCSSVVSAAKFVQAALQEQGATEKKQQKNLHCKLQAIFMEVENSFQIFLSQSLEAAESILQYNIYIL